MAAIRVEVKGLSQTLRRIDRLRRELRLSAGEFADVAARSVRDTVVRNTQPFGSARKAQEAGKGAIRKDLMRCFTVVPDAARGRRGTIVSIAAARRWHTSRRGRGGRVSSGQKKPIVSSVFRAFFDELADKVGMAKGSVSGGGDSRLKGRVARWVGRWSSAGDARRMRGLGGASWKFSAEPQHVASSRVLGARGVQKVLRAKDRNLMRVLERRQRAILKAAGRGL